MMDLENPLESYRMAQGNGEETNSGNRLVQGNGAKDDRLIHGIVEEKN